MLVYTPTTQDFDLSVCLDDDFFFAICGQTHQPPVELGVLFLSQWNYNYHFRDVVLDGLLLAPATSPGSKGASVRCGIFEIKPGLQDEKVLAELRQKANRMQRLNPRKESFEGI